MNYVFAIADIFYFFSQEKKPTFISDFFIYIDLFTTTLSAALEKVQTEVGDYGILIYIHFMLLLLFVYSFADGNYDGDDDEDGDDDDDDDDDDGKLSLNFTDKSTLSSNPLSAGEIG